MSITLARSRLTSEIHCIMIITRTVFALMAERTCSDKRGDAGYRNKIMGVLSDCQKQTVVSI